MVKRGILPSSKMQNTVNVSFSYSNTFVNETQYMVHQILFGRREAGVALSPHVVVHTTCLVDTTLSLSATIK